MVSQAPSLTNDAVSNPDIPHSLHRMLWTLSEVVESLSKDLKIRGRITNARVNRLLESFVERHGRHALTEVGEKQLGHWEKRRDLVEKAIIRYHEQDPSYSLRAQPPIDHGSTIWRKRVLDFESYVEEKRRRRDNNTKDVIPDSS